MLSRPWLVSSRPVKISHVPRFVSYAMSTFDLPGFSPSVKVTLPEELSQQQLLSFPAFNTWVSTLKHSLSLQHREDHAFHGDPYKLRSIDVQAADWFGKSRLGFVKLKAEVTNDSGEHLPGSVFLRGGSVAMLVCSFTRKVNSHHFVSNGKRLTCLELTLQPEDVPVGTEEDKYVILTIQPRIPVGSLSFPEIPAGMLDDSGSMKGAAMKEIQEETGLEVTEKDLTNLSELALHASPMKLEGEEKLQVATYPSAGGSDEFIPVMLAQKRVKRNDLDSWRGRLTGLRDEGEKITLSLCRLEDLWKVGVRDAKTMTAWGLYSGLKKEGKV